MVTQRHKCVLRGLRKQERQKAALTRRERDAKQWRARAKECGPKDTVVLTIRGHDVWFNKEDCIHKAKLAEKECETLRERLGVT